LNIDLGIKEKIKRLPSLPGVYFMKDSLGTVIYVGKSKNLKNRVGSYFMNSKSHSTKVTKLVKNLKDFDYESADTEFDALLLECKLIKEIKPIYNRKMKSPKGYCYIRIKTDEKYPDIEICSEPGGLEGTLYFGPYTNKNTVEKALYGIKEHSKILCTNISRKSSGCLEYSMNRCIGMCTDIPSKEQYSALLEKVVKLLRGVDLTVLEEMELHMDSCALELNFEGAAKYRDYITAAKHLTSNANIISFIEKNKNIALAEPVNDKEIKLYLLRYNKLLYSERYDLDDFSSDEIKRELKDKILSHFSDDLDTPAVIGKNEIDEIHIIYSYLKSKVSTCKYMPVQEQWIKNMDSLSIYGAVDELISDVLKMQGVVFSNL
jgi:excinuclease ABC subunit C